MRNSILNEIRKEYKVAYENNKLRTVHSLIKKETGLKISAKILRDFLNYTKWEGIIEKGMVADYFDAKLDDNQLTTVLEILNSTNYNKTMETQKTNEMKKVEPTQKTQKVSPVVTAMPDVVNFGINLPIGNIIEESIKQLIPEIMDAKTEELRSKIEEVAKTLQPNVIHVNHKECGEVKGKLHKEFEEALTILTSQGRLFLKGDAGTGKTWLAEQLAEGLGLDFDALSLTAGISEGYLIGRTTINGDFIGTSFLDIFENGGVFLLDEVDAADANTLLILNKALSSNSMPVPMRTENPIAKKHKDFYIICCANTWGNGTDLQYSGREYLDEAFLNRFSVAKLEIDYDVQLEKDLLATEPKLCEVLQEMRNNARKNGVMRTISTRTLVDAYKYKTTGKTLDEVINRITTGWTREEIKKVEIK